MRCNTGTLDIDIYFFSWSLARLDVLDLQIVWRRFAIKLIYINVILNVCRLLVVVCDRLLIAAFVWHGVWSRRLVQKVR